MNHDTFRTELLRMGATKQQAESKVVQMCIDIMAKELPEDRYRLYEETREKAEEARLQVLKNEHYRLEAWREEYGRREEELETMERKIRNKATDLQFKEIEYNQREEELNKLAEKLKNCETPQAKDAIRKAEYYKANIDIDSKYANTEYIKALGLILAGCGQEQSNDN